MFVPVAMLKMMMMPFVESLFVPMMPFLEWMRIEPWIQNIEGQRQSNGSMLLSFASSSIVNILLYPKTLHVRSFLLLVFVFCFMFVCLFFKYDLTTYFCQVRNRQQETGEICFG